RPAQLRMGDHLLRHPLTPLPLRPRRDPCSAPLHAAWRQSHGCRARPARWAAGLGRVLSRDMSDRCRGTLLTLSGGSSGSWVEGLVLAFGVDGEFSDEPAVDEDVRAGAGEHGGGAGLVVRNTERDAVGAGPDDT